MITDFDMKLTGKLLSQYKKSNKKEKGQILAKYRQLTGVNKNTAAKRFRKQIKNPYPRILSGKDKKSRRKKRGPKKKYTAVHQRIIKNCWELAGNICGEKLHPMLPIYLKQLRENGELRFCSPKEINQTKQISLGSLKNIIAQFPKTSSKKHKGNAFIYKQVPIMANFGQFAKEKPGYTEVDFVEHNGGCSSGTFGVTGVYVDLFSQWVARAAGLGKNLNSVTRIDKLAHQKILHQILHYHPDNDKPILKLLFERMKTKKKKPFKLSRSRPYKKNDNAHVEQKNGDKVRKLVGHYRHDTQEEINLLNCLYQRADLLDNFFIASAKLKTKIRDNKGRVTKRIHDTPQTPYQRLIESRDISKKTIEELKKIYHSLNMLKLRKETEIFLNKLFKIQLKKQKDFKEKK